MKFYSFLFLFFCLGILTAQTKDNISSQTGYVKGEFVFSPEEKPTRQCHASTIENTADGLVASWFAGTEEKNPDVGIWVSRNVNGKWIKSVEVANGIWKDGKRYPCWNPILFKPSGAQLMLFYKVGPDPVDWWGLYMTSNDNGITWSKPVELPKNILGPIKNKPVQLSDGTIISPTSTENDGWKVCMEISSDTGKTWKLIGPINDGKTYSAIQPTVLIHKNALEILCRSKQGSILQSWSKDNGKSWSELSPINLPNPNSGIDAVTMKDGRHLLVYNHTGMIEGKWGGLRYPLNVAISDDGIFWKSVLVLETEPGEYSYPAVIQSPDGLIHITYTFQRELIKHVVLDPSLIK
jgi:predicted neuraminidase